MKKKPYQAPAVRKVRLVVEDAVLAVCHTSPAQDPKGAISCEITPGCWKPPGN